MMGLKIAMMERMQELESAYHESVRFTEKRLVALEEKIDILLTRIPLQCSEPDAKAHATPMMCSEIVQFVDAPLARTDTSELQVSLSKIVATDGDTVTPLTHCPSAPDTPLEDEVGEIVTPSNGPELQLQPRQLMQNFDASVSTACQTWFNLHDIHELECFADEYEKLFKKGGWKSTCKEGSRTASTWE